MVAAMKDESTYVLQRVSDVPPTPIHWLWRKFIPAGKLTVLAGMPGLGKSQLTTHLAAVVTQGAMWPDGSRCPIQGAVIFITCEDDVADTVRPRLEAAGADVTQVHVLKAVRDANGAERFFDLGRDITILKNMIRDKGARMVVVDPVTAYAGRADSHKASDIRGQLDPLAKLAADTGTAIVLVTHLSKDVKNENAMSRVTGSFAYVAAPRGAFLVAHDPGDPTRTRRLLVSLKTNIGPDGNGFAFQIVGLTLDGGIETSKIEFLDPVRIDPDLLMQTRKTTVEKQNALGEAKSFLLLELAEGPRPQKALERDAVRAGISVATLRRAKSALGVRSRPDPYSKAWYWRLPKQSIHEDDHRPSTPQNHAHLEQVDHDEAVRSNGLGTFHTQDDQAEQDDQVVKADHVRATALVGSLSLDDFEGGDQ